MPSGVVAIPATAEASGERFLSWKSLAATRVRINSARARYAIEDVHLVEPGAKLVINKDRSVNVSDVLRETEKPPAASEPAAPAPATADKRGEPRFTVLVNRVRVDKGTLDFADLSLVLPFSTQIRDLGGSITGLSSDAGSRAGVKLEGQVEDYGLARIDGTINPFTPKAHTDISVVFRNVHMTPFSPYSATFAGRKIASGRLSLDLQYKQRAPALQKVSPRKVEEDTAQALSELDRQRTERMLRENVPGPSRRPDLDRDVIQGIQSRGLGR